VPEASDDAARRSPDHWIWLALFLSGPLVLVALRFLVEPDARGHGTHEQLGLPPCSSMERWNVPCPGCGVTTSAALLVRGRPLEALYDQPLGFLLALAAPILAVAALRAHLRGRDLALAIGAAVTPGRALAFGALVLAAWLWKIHITA